MQCRVLAYLYTGPLPDLVSAAPRLDGANEMGEQGVRAGGTDIYKNLLMAAGAAASGHFATFLFPN